MGRLDGKVALISGAAHGQGAAEARLFVAEGARVVLGDVLVEEVTDVAASLGTAARAVALDVTDASGWAAAVETAEAGFGRLDVLVNNAGIVRAGMLADLAIDDYRAVVEVNQIGTLLGMQAAIPALRRAGGGSIVNISSIDGIAPMAGMTAYAASKFAVRGMTKVAALELGPDGIRVNSVHPGGVRTPMTGIDAVGFDVAPLFGGLPLGRIGEAEEIAPLVAFLASDDASYCTGAEFVADGGWIAGHAFTPPG
jgi:3alpha(or 20beta)-hydroxysteroid dehydrogenase